MPDRSSKKRDFNELAKAIVDQATGQTGPGAEDMLAKAEAEGKNIAAVALGRLGGLKGGKARAESLTAAQRSEIAKKAASVRWAAKTSRKGPKA